MAGGAQGMVHWPGITSVISADMTFSQGVSPSVCTIVIPAGTSQPAEHGTLTFMFDGQVVASFPDCKLIDTSITVGDSGQVQVLTIKDRRWKWKWGGVPGVFNQRWANGTLNKWRERPPSFLMRYALAYLDEKNPDLSRVGFNDQRPEVQWSWDRPAQMLEDLCDFFGLRVVLGLDNRVHIWPVGEGSMLPSGPMTEDAIIFDPPEEPYRIRFVGGPNRYQHDFGLVPVGRDLDGEIKLIDELSYRPSVGWEREAPWAFTNVLKEHGIAAWQWAKRCIWRWYRIWGNKDLSLPIHIPGYGDLQDGWQIVPVENEQVATWADFRSVQPFFGRKKKDLSVVNIAEIKGGAFDVTEFKATENVQAQVFGIRRDMTQTFKNTKFDDLYIGAFSIERDEGIVKFHDHILRREGGIRLPARIWLRTAVSVRDPDTRDWERFTVEREQGKVETPTQILRHEEVVLSHIDGVTVNFQECLRDAEHYLESAAREYRTLTPQCRSYAGLVPIDLDGAIQQVSWHVGPPYAWTQASRNNEFSTMVPGYEQRRRNEKLSKTWLAEQEAQTRVARALKNNRNPFEPAR